MVSSPQIEGFVLITLYLFFLHINFLNFIDDTHFNIRINFSILFDRFCFHFYSWSVLYEAFVLIKNNLYSGSIFKVLLILLLHLCEQAPNARHVASLLEAPFYRSAQNDLSYNKVSWLFLCLIFNIKLKQNRVPAFYHSLIYKEACLQAFRLWHKIGTWRQSSIFVAAWPLSKSTLSAQYPFSNKINRLSFR